jgi:hypothetical protein
MLVSLGALGGFHLNICPYKQTQFVSVYKLAPGGGIALASTMEIPLRLAKGKSDDW